MPWVDTIVSYVSQPHACNLLNASKSTALYDTLSGLFLQGRIMPKVDGGFLGRMWENSPRTNENDMEKCREREIKCGKGENAPEITGDFHEICQKNRRMIQKNLTEPEPWCHTLDR